MGLEIDAEMTAGPLGTMITAAIVSGGGAAVPLVGPALGVGRLVSDHLNRQRIALLTEAVQKAARRGAWLAGAGLALQGVEIALKFYELATYEKRLDQAVRAQQWLDALRSAQETALARLEHGFRLAEARYEAVLASYPFHAPPGTLAEELLLTPGGRTRPVLLIPADPPDVPAHSPWTGVRHRTVGELRKYPGALDVRATDRAFEWPHAELLRRDLDAVPAVYLQLGTTGYDLEVRLGGSALLPGEILSVLPAVTLRRVGYREPWEWTAEELTALGAPADGPPSPGRNADLNFERAARVAAFTAVMAADAHQLMHRPAYDEQVDAAAARAGLTLAAWPPGLGVPLELVADPPYHLLHPALRHHVRGDGEAALFTVAAAAAWLAGEETGRPTRLADVLTREAGSGRMTAAHGRKFREAVAALGTTARLPARLHRALDALPAQAPAGPAAPAATNDPGDAPGLFPPAGRPLL